MKTSTELPMIGSFIAFISGLSLGDWASLFGIVFGLATVLISWYYKHKEYKLKELALKNHVNWDKINDETSL